MNKAHPVKEILSSIIIPVFNKLNLTKQCLEAILKSSPLHPFELIIVDDNSSDGTPYYLQYISKQYSFIRTLRNKINRGFAYACNQGAKIAKGRYLVFLNNDTVPLPGWLEAMVEVVERDKSIAIVGAKLLYPNGTIQHAGVLFGNVPFPLCPFHAFAGKPSNLPDANIERDYEAVTAACMLVRKEVFEKLGGFDEQFTNGYEDVDFCLKVRKIGYRVVYTPKSVLYHLENSSPGCFDHAISNLRLFHNRWMGRVKYDIKREPKVSVIIVNYNSWDDTLEAISSLFVREQYKRFNVIIIDNCSEVDYPDKVEIMCRKLGHPFVRLTENVSSKAEFKQEVFLKRLDVNKGFGGGCNEGISLAISWGADYVWLLNSDTLVGDLALYYLVSLAEYLKDAAIIGSKLHCYPDIEKVQFDGISISYRGTTPNSRKQEHILPVEFVFGASMLIRADFLKTHGLLREDYFLYFEDNEICLRALRKGFKVIYHPLSIIYHKGGTTIGAFMESPTSIYYGVRNSLFFYEEFGENKIPATLKLLEQSLFPHLLAEGDKAGIEAAMMAICDFFADKRGARSYEAFEESVFQKPLCISQPDYEKLRNHLLQLGKSILRNPHQRDILEIYFDTVKTLMTLRKKLKSKSVTCFKTCQ